MIEPEHVKEEHGATKISTSDAMAALAKALADGDPVTVDEKIGIVNASFAAITKVSFEEDCDEVLPVGEKMHVRITSSRTCEDGNGMTITEASGVVVAPESPEARESREALENGVCDTTRAKPRLEVMDGDLSDSLLGNYHRLVEDGLALTSAAYGASRATIWHALTPDSSLLVIQDSVHLHDDRHMLDTTAPESYQHTWNWVMASASEYSDQSMALLMEVSEAGDFRHAELLPGNLIYMNTINRHMVTKPVDACSIRVVILQLYGYGPDQLEEVQNRFRQILEENPTLKPAHRWPEKEE